MSSSSEMNNVNRFLPIHIVSKVVRGYGRGSSDLGIPTANVSRENGEFSTSFDDLPCGIYWGFARIGDTSEKNETVYKTAVSIGFNPYYGNEKKTVEPHLIASPLDKRRHQSSCGETVLREFYGETIRLSIVGYLRPELPFEGIEKLIEAIKNDIKKSELLCEGNDARTIEERDWVEGTGGV